AVGFLVVGANAFGSTTCSSYTSAYLGLFAIGWAASGTCITLPNATATATYTGTPASGLRSDGIPTSFTYNKTLGTSSNFVPYGWFAKGTTNTAFLKAGANPVGAFKSSGGRDAAIAADPALLAAILPNANNWGTGQAGTSVAYNVMNFLCYFSTSSVTGRALSDFSVAQATIVGVNHAKLSTVYVGVRDNGPITGLVTVTLFVNGSVALYQGIVVATSVTVNANGAIAWISLTWVAPANGPFSLSVVLNAPYVVNFNQQDNQMPLNPLNQPTTFA
ncbi:MAG: hypothetical protein L3J73_04225, partial [Thermoplasmata archaeon]|nr:hypothetical protein [Thermoplasmata archaeon]